MNKVVANGEVAINDIPDNAIYRRYPRIMHNLINLYLPLFDKVSCYDNSNPEPVPIFEQTSKNVNIIDDTIVWRHIKWDSLVV